MKRLQQVGMDIEYVYIFGDFTSSLEYARSKENTNYGGYSLLFNNCLHFVQDALEKGKFRNPLVEKTVRRYKGRVPSTFAKHVSVAATVGYAIESIR